MKKQVELAVDDARPGATARLLATANVQVHRLSRLLSVAKADERGRLARELHDDVQQILVGLRMNMESSIRAPALVPGDDTKAWVVLLQKAIEHLHILTVSLHPPGLGQDGLAGELRAHVSRLALAEGQTIELDLNLGAQQFAPEIEVACFRIVQEALANAIKHSNATHLRVTLKRSRYELCVFIDDDGIGFDVPSTRAHAHRAGSMGLRSMGERAALAGGHLQVLSSAGHGTHIRGHFKIHSLGS
jgi:signal transduction histidine kinase